MVEGPGRRGGPGVRARGEGSEREGRGKEALRAGVKVASRWRRRGWGARLACERIMQQRGGGVACGAREEDYFCAEVNHDANFIHELQIQESDLSLHVLI